MNKKMVYLLFAKNIFLSACSNTIEGFSLKKKSNSGNEFLVKKKDPLILPPNFKKLPTYKFISTSGPRHKPMFKVGVKLQNSKLYIAEGSSKKDAEQNAATLCLESAQRK